MAEEETFEVAEDGAIFVIRADGTRREVLFEPSRPPCREQAEDAVRLGLPIHFHLDLLRPFPPHRLPRA